MKLSIDEAADALHLQLVDRDAVESEEVASGVILPSASKIGHTEFVSNPHFTWPGNGGDLLIIGIRWE